MVTNSIYQERRKFIGRALGVGTLVWIAPAIITVSANKGHAALSGQEYKDKDKEKDKKEKKDHKVK